MISGALAGIGGAIYAQSVSVNFAVTTIVGPGFIALAAMIFGKWNPIGAMLASLFFGASQSLAVIGNQLPLLKGIPSIYLQIAPYVLTMVVLAAFFGQAVAPKADDLISTMFGGKEILRKDLHHVKALPFIEVSPVK